MKRYLSSFIAITAISASALAQQPTLLSMNDCMEYAIRHNYTIKNAKLDVLIQKAQNDQTLSASYPHINGKVEFDDFLKPTQSFLNYKSLGYPRDSMVHFAFTLPYAASAGVSGSQLIFDGAVFVAWKARNTVLEFAKLNSEVTEEGIRYNIYKSYNSLVIAYRQYDIIKQSLSFARSMQHDMEVTHENGFSEKIDVERTEVQVNNLANDSVRIGNMLAVSEQLLKYQMGMDINTPILLTDTAVEERKRNTLSLFNEDVRYERVPEFKVLSTAIKLNEYNLERYKLSAAPSINAFGAYGWNYGSDRFSDMFRLKNYLQNATIGLQLNMPIFNGYIRHFQMDEAKLNIEKSKNNVESLKQSIDFQTAMSRTTLKNAVIQAQSQHKNMDVANDVLTLAQKKYKEGVGSNIEVTQAQTDLLRAQSNYFSALQDLVNAEADLKKALGLLKTNQ